MADTIPDFLRDAINNHKERPGSEQSIQALREAIQETRDLEFEKKDTKRKLESINKQLDKMYMGKLPDLLDEARVSSMVLDAEGNHPGVKAEAKPYYHANISADWPEDKREEAFEYLEEHGGGPLIRYTVSVDFGKGEIEQAKKLIAELHSQGFVVSTKKHVPWAALTSWLKEQVEKVGHTPDLSILGATIGRIVKLTER